MSITNQVHIPMDSAATNVRIEGRENEWCQQQLRNTASPEISCNRENILTSINLLPRPIPSFLSRIIELAVIQVHYHTVIPVRNLRVQHGHWAFVNAGDRKANRMGSWVRAFWVQGICIGFDRLS